MDVIAYLEGQRERNIAIAQGMLKRVNEIPPLLNPLLEQDQYMEAAELL